MTPTTLMAATVTAANVVGTTNVTFGGVSGLAHTHAGGTLPGGNTGSPIV